MAGRAAVVVAVLLAALGGVVPGGGAEKAPRIVFEQPPGAPPRVEVHGLDPDRLTRLEGLPLEQASWEDLLAVRVVWLADEAGPAPAVLGRYRVADGLLVFEPHFPFKPGLNLVARFDGERFDRLTGGEDDPGTASVGLRFRAPETAAGPQTRVVAVYPTADPVPENLLRIYVHFSGPMRPKDVAAAVRLYEEGSGAAVEPAFVEVDEGLWDPGRRRLTLFLHPGRIKRGVGPHEALGPPLVAGRSYRLSIGRELRDARGRPLEAEYSQRLRVGEADRESPDPAGWSVTPPRPPSGELVVDLPEPMDRALLLRMIEVLDPEGEPVPGLTTVAVGERRWSFRPAAEWGEGGYRLRVATAIEDLAGNTPAGLFDREAGAVPGPSEPFVDLGFEIR